MLFLPCILFLFFAWAQPSGCSLISSNLMPPSFLPAGVRGIGGLDIEGLLRDGDRKPPGGTRLGIPFSGVVSVILRGMPRDRTGTVGAVLFFRLLAASADFCRSSALSAADLGLRFRVKCLVGGGCCPTTLTSADLFRQ